MLQNMPIFWCRTIPTDSIGQGSDVLVVFVQPRRGFEVAAGRRTPVFWSSIVIEAPFGQRGQ